LRLFRGDWRIICGDGRRFGKIVIDFAR